MRLADRTAVVVGAGQSPGEGVGNGRATAMVFAREGAAVLCVDRNLTSAEIVNQVEQITHQLEMLADMELQAALGSSSAWGQVETALDTLAQRAEAITDKTSAKLKTLIAQLEDIGIGPRPVGHR